MYIVHAPSTPCTIRIYICVCVLNRIIRRVNVCVYRPFAETFRNILSASVRAVARSSSAACENGGSYIYIHNLTVLREGRCVRMFRKGNARTRVNDITHAGRTSSSLLNRPFTSRSFIKARIISRNLYTLSLRCPPPPHPPFIFYEIFSLPRPNVRISYEIAPDVVMIFVCLLASRAYSFCRAHSFRSIVNKKIYIFFNNYYSSVR